jgi:hypothetical protein
MTESQEAAVAILNQGHDEVRALIGRLPAAWRARPGLGGGQWSPKDLIGHLASWEEHALEALDHWSRGERAPIDGDLHVMGVNAVNARAVEARSALTYDEVLHDAEVAHASVVRALGIITEAAWERPATSRGRKALGHRLGQILGGPTGDFRHAEAHLPSLRAFVERASRDG